MKLFRPELSIDELSSLVENQPCLGGLEKENDQLYELLSKLTGIAVPSNKTEYDKNWEDFYLPLRRKKRITIPVSIKEYNNRFFIDFKNVGYLAIKPGSAEVNPKIIAVFNDILRFIPLLQESNNQIAYRTTPFDIRTGKILGRYVLKDLLPKEEKNRLLAKYKEHQGGGLEISVSDISLERYLETASFCYKAAFPEETKEMVPLEMYKRWADFRHGGMLDISDTGSKREFLEWHQSEEWKGCHPFEIVYSAFGHGIHLYPPSSSEERPSFWLRVTDKALAFKFIKMAEALIDEKIPFISPNFEGIVDYLAGDSSFYVNRGYGLDCFRYYDSPEMKPYLDLIEWDDLNFVQWK